MWSRHLLFILRKCQHITTFVQNGKFGGTVEGGFDGLDDFHQVFDAVVESAEVTLCVEIILIENYQYNFGGFPL